MVVSTFTVFVDSVSPPQPTSIPSKSLRKPQRAHEHSDSTTKENVNPLTGELFDSQPPLKKRKPSSTTVLKSKAIASSSKSASKPAKSLTGKERKEKGKRRKLAVLETIGKQEHINSEIASITALGNRKSYEFTVMPLADVTRAYDESEAAPSANVHDPRDLENGESENTNFVAIVGNTALHKVKHSSLLRY